MGLAVGSLSNKIQFALEISLIKSPFTRISKLKGIKRMLLSSRSSFFYHHLYFLISLLETVVLLGFFKTRWFLPITGDYN